MQANPYLVVSSLLFLVPTTYAAYTRIWSAYAVLLYITAVSSLYHATKNEKLFYLDQTACILYAAYSGYQLYKNNVIYVWYFSAGFSILVYYGGYLTNSMVYSPNIVIATMCDIMMHFICITSGITIIYIIDSRNKSITLSV